MQLSHGFRDVDHKEYTVRDISNSIKLYATWLVCEKNAFSKLATRIVTIVLLVLNDYFNEIFKCQT